MTDNTLDNLDKEIDEIVNDILHCQKMVDAGVEGWDKYGDRLIELQYTELPKVINQKINKSVYEALWRLKEKQDKASKFGEMLVIGVGHIHQELDKVRSLTKESK